MIVSAGTRANHGVNASVRHRPRTPRCPSARHPRCVRASRTDKPLPSAATFPDNRNGRSGGKRRRAGMCPNGRLRRRGRPRRRGNGRRWSRRCRRGNCRRWNRRCRRGNCQRGRANRLPPTARSRTGVGLRRSSGRAQRPRQGRPCQRPTGRQPRRRRPRRSARQGLTGHPSRHRHRRRRKVSPERKHKSSPERGRRTRRQCGASAQ